MKNSGTAPLTMSPSTPTNEWCFGSRMGRKSQRSYENSKNRLGTAEEDSAAPGLFYFVLFVLSVPGVQRKTVHDRSCSRPWAASYINIKNNHLSFISYNDCNYHQAVIWGTPGCGKWDITVCSTVEMFRKSLISRRKHLQNSRK